MNKQKLKDTKEKYENIKRYYILSRDVDNVKKYILITENYNRKHNACWATTKHNLDGHR